MSRAWIDGRLVDEREARVSVFDHGLLVGDGVFETLRLYGGRPFALRRHLDRLARSAAGLGLTMPDRAEVETAVDAVAGANPACAEGRVRITITSGVGPLGSARGEDRPTVVVTAGPVAPLPATYAVAVAPWTRNERGALAGLKTISYAENARALAWARALGADEAVLANTAGRLCEGTGTNVFAVVGGRLLTPPVTAGCLAGVTRDLLVERCGAVEEDVPIGALATADEAFLTGTVTEVRPIASVDGAPLPAAPGPVTTEVAAAFAGLVATEIDP